MLPNPEAVLEGLNGRQREAVTATEPAVLVIAGPGSGKTRALAHRIAYLIAAGTPPETILAVTFTNKAAQEMRERVAKLLRSGDQYGRVQQTKQSTKRSEPPALPFIGTFHSFAAALLRREAGRIGYRSGFSIYDGDDTLALIRELLREENLSAETHPPALVAAVISNLKSNLIAWDEYEGRDAAEFFPRTAARLYENYQRRLRFANAMDFDDLIFWTVRLFRDDPGVLNRWQARAHHLLIDEYQDTGTSQYELLRLLAGETGSIFAIGDDAQSIYGWRQADYRNILNFERDWPEGRIVLLEENYRSTPQILEAANRLIRQNRSQKPKTLWTRNAAGSLPVVRAEPNEQAEAEFIAEEILAICREGRRPWSACAVLYRVNAQSRALEEAMLERAIPHVLIGAVRFFERREVKDLIAYLRYLMNPEDRLALKRMVNVPARGIGPRTFLAYLGGATGELAPREQGKIARFEALVAHLREGTTGRTLAEFLRFLIKAIGYEAYLESAGRDAESRRENVRELVSLARRYDALPISEAIAKLLEDAALLSEQDEIREGEDRVKLMTIHTAKGLEFPVVFVAGWEEGTMPHARAMAAGPAELEEERRLAYVGMTRAKERLYLTWAVQRSRFGEVQANIPSRFLRELPPEILAGADRNADDLLIVEQEA